MNTLNQTPAMKLLLFLSAICLFSFTNAQEENKTDSKPPFLKPNTEKLFSPIVNIECWTTYSMNETKPDQETANRADVSFRRLRFGGKGAPYNWLKYSFQLHLDRLGEDSYASTKGSYKGLGIWNAYISAKILKNNELLNFHAGYYWAAISREFNTSPWAVGSFDKTRANFYMRNFITGTGNGIESGFGLGGLKNFDNFGISYRIGTYEPQAYASAKYQSRLYTGRLMISIGEPEQKKYKFMLSGNQWMKRTGITIGCGAAIQSDGKMTDTSYFDNSMAYGADILLNFKGLRIDGEYYLFNRTAEGSDDFDGTEFHIRTGYSFVAGGKYIEACITYEKYEGKGSKLYKLGDDTSFDFGLNWYINKDKLKASLHYVIQNGTCSSNLGDYAGIAVQTKL